MRFAERRPAGDDEHGQATKLCRLGATDAQLTDFFGADDRTTARWKAGKPEFCRALEGSASFENLISFKVNQTAGDTFENRPEQANGAR